MRMWRVDWLVALALAALWMPPAEGQDGPWRELGTCPRTAPTPFQAATTGPDGIVLAIDEEGSLFAWSAATGKLVCRRPNVASGHVAAFRAIDESALAFFSQGSTVVWYDWRRGQVVAALDEPGYPVLLGHRTLLRQGNGLLIVTSNGRRHWIPSPPDKVDKFQFLGRALLALGRDGRLWRYTERGWVRMEQFGERFADFAAGPDGRTVFVLRPDGCVERLHLDDGHVAWRQQLPGLANVLGVKKCWCGALMVAAQRDSEEAEVIHVLLSPGDGSVLRQLRGAAGAMVWCTGKRHGLAQTVGAHLALWPKPEAQSSHCCGHWGPVHWLTFIARDRLLSADAYRLCLWRTDRSEPMASLALDVRGVPAATYLPSRSTVVVTTAPNRIACVAVDAAHLRVMRTLVLPPNVVVTALGCTEYKGDELLLVGYRDRGSPRAGLRAYRLTGGQMNFFGEASFHGPYPVQFGGSADQEAIVILLADQNLALWRPGAPPDRFPELPWDASLFRSTVLQADRALAGQIFFSGIGAESLEADDTLWELYAVDRELKELAFEQPAGAWKVLGFRGTGKRLRLALASGRWFLYEKTAHPREGTLADYEQRLPSPPTSAAIGHGVVAVGTASGRIFLVYPETP